MPVEVGIWRLGTKTERVLFTPMPTEKKLEEILDADISILDPELLIVGRQVPTSFGKFIDLLAIDADGKLVVIELKRDRTPREVIAQLLDYGSWVRTLKDEDIAACYDSYLKKYHPSKTESSLDSAFCKKFSTKEMPEVINEGHELIVVASELDDSTERIVTYLSDEYGVSINAVFFRFFKEQTNEYLSRVWLIDPGEVETKVTEKRTDDPWNGEYYVSFGHDEDRSWEDARKYGYIAAGGKDWYSRTLQLLEPGARIWVNVPGVGYVGVGTVLERSKPITEFKVKDDTGLFVPVQSVLAIQPEVTNKSLDELEHFVSVKWIKTVPLEEAIKEKGFFGNQNSVAKPRSKKWVFTVERLKARFGIS